MTVLVAVLAILGAGCGGDDSTDATVTTTTSGVESKKVLLLVGDKTNLSAFDPPLKARLEEQHGAQVTVEQSDAFDAQGLDTLARQHDLVLISESIGSSTVLQDGAFVLQDTPVPVISFEVYMWEEAFWSKAPDGVRVGNTGHSNVMGEALADGLDVVTTDIYITAKGDQHPMGASLTGVVTVHTEAYSVNFGTPSEDAAVIATADATGKWATHFVYDQGDKLVDGSTAPAARIAMFVGQPATGHPTADRRPEEGFYTDEGFALIDEMFVYALSP